MTAIHIHSRSGSVIDQLWRDLGIMPQIACQLVGGPATSLCPAALVPAAQWGRRALTVL
jgi:hypothetical protein